VSVGAPAHLDAAEYAALVQRVRAAVAATVPAGSSVLVLSKGDAELLAMPGMTAAHFPQDRTTAEYAGHHPHDSAEAIAQLEALRRRGAEYLVVPATARWWLDHYTGFAEHLANRARVVADDGASCLILDLGRRIGAEGACGKPTNPSQTSIAQMRDYLERLLPADTSIAVLGAHGLAAQLTPLRAVDVEPAALQDAGDGRPLRDLRAGGAAYLVVPRDADAWLGSHVDAAAALEAHARKIADQRHLCRVYELHAWGRP
jgi:hypothetical protein